MRSAATLFSASRCYDRGRRRTSASGRVVEWLGGQLSSRCQAWSEAGRPLAAACALGALGLVGCTQFDRGPPGPFAEVSRASVLGIANARFLADGDPAPMIAEFRR